MTLELSQLKEAGAVFEYPNSLSIWEWAGLMALQRARAVDREKEMRKAQAQKPGSSLRAKLGR